LVGLVGETRTEDRAQLTTSKRIEQTAVDLFFERGFKTTTVREIALAAGITGGALYNHFPSKDHLLSSILKGIHRELRRWFEEALSKASNDPRDELEALVRAHAVFHTQFRKEARVANQEVFSLLEPDRAEVISERRWGLQLVVDIIERGNRTGVFEVSNAKVVAMAILNMGIAIAAWFRPDGALLPDGVADLHAELALKMVAPANS
jgi:AcrR family transcriptional regulator